MRHHLNIRSYKSKVSLIVLSECVSESCIIDNHLYSDHVSLTIIIDIDVNHEEWTFRKKQQGLKQIIMIFSHKKNL